MITKPTRDALGEVLTEIAQNNQNIVSVNCDIGKSCKTLDFGKKYPNQFINVGIAEQNACGVAAGLATCGKIPFISTYAVFGSMRMSEQIRQEICYPNLNVKICCSHGGLTPANDGASHQGIEDMGIMRTLPNMKVIMPADYTSAKKLVMCMAKDFGATYIRFTRDEVEGIYDETQEFEIGKAVCLKEGKDIAIIANGDVVRLGLKAEQKLAQEGISASVYDFHTIKPIDKDVILKEIKKCGKIITVEDHTVINGLGSAVCEIVAEQGCGKVHRIGIQDRFGESGPYEELLRSQGISVEAIEMAARSLSDT
ncbi:MAG: transketolase C-terminal domain-containing protein [Spirochaetales bacterium]